MSDTFKALERAPADSRHDLDGVLAAIRFNVDGLMPAIAQQHDSGEVLMMAWMNREALEETLRTGRVCYWSRSRGKLWHKGESSGQQQHLKSAARCGRPVRSGPPAAAGCRRRSPGRRS